MRRGKIGRLAATGPVRRRRTAPSRGLYFIDSRGPEESSDQATGGSHRTAGLCQPRAGRAEPLEHGAVRRVETTAAETGCGGGVRSFHWREGPAWNAAFAVETG